MIELDWANGWPVFLMAAIALVIVVANLASSRGAHKDRADSHAKTIAALVNLDPALLDAFGRDAGWNGERRELDEGKVQRLGRIQRERGQRLADTTELDQALATLAAPRKEHE